MAAVSSCISLFMSALTYCKTNYSRNGIKLKLILDKFKSMNFNHIASIKSFDLSTRYTTVPMQKLKNRIASIICDTFPLQNGKRRNTDFVIKWNDTYFVKEDSDTERKYIEGDIIKILEFDWQHFLVALERLFSFFLLPNLALDRKKAPWISFSYNIDT